MGTAVWLRAYVWLLHARLATAWGIDAWGMHGSARARMRPRLADPRYYPRY